MEQRRLFLERYLAREVPFAALCRDFGVSREVGYRLVRRLRAEGRDAAARPRTSAPRDHPNAVPAAVVAALVAARDAHPTWGPRKLRALLARDAPRWVLPAASTIGVVLTRHGRVAPRRRRRRTPPHAGPLVHARAPNDVWCADFKGWWRTRDGARVDPLTVSDACTRFLVRAVVVARADGAHVAAVLRGAFREHGLPGALRTDNGAPFASTGLAGLSRLSVWLIKLGVRPERIAPGCPQENGRHERLHRTLQAEVAADPAARARAQQRALDRWRAEYNAVRPHDALGGATPASRYVVAAPRALPARLPAVGYDAGVTVRRVRCNGGIKFAGHDIHLSDALAGEPVALVQRSDRLWQVRFATVVLTQLDAATGQLVRPPRRRRRARRHATR